MVFKGTERRSAQAIAEEIEAVGGQINAYTSRENTAFYAQVLAENARPALDIVADILQRSTFLEEELERERAAGLQEIRQDRRSAVSGKSVAGRLSLGGRRIIQQKPKTI